MSSNPSIASISSSASAKKTFPRRIKLKIPAILFAIPMKPIRLAVLSIGPIMAIYGLAAV